MKILNASQIQELDAYTIKHEPIDSADLMERAATRWTEKCIELAHEISGATIFCGSGNNGGDGAVIARLLATRGIPVRVYLCHIGPFSEDLKKNLGRLKTLSSDQLEIMDLQKGDLFPEIAQGHLVVDGIFGSGLNRPVTGEWAEVITAINKAPNRVYSIDIPSGLHPDRSMEGAIIRADVTITFELPKYTFMFPENAGYVGQLEIVSIGLHQEFLERLESKNEYLTGTEVSRLITPRSKFDHKGVYGHGLIIAGSVGKMGAALLAGRGALRSGIGLLTLHIPQKGVIIVQTGLPEAMVSIDRHGYCFSECPDSTPYQAIGIGCGITTSEISRNALRETLDAVTVPMVIDADALNIIGMHPELLEKVPHESILTPHFKEFERLFGPSENHEQRLEKARVNAQKYNVNILLKGAHSALADTSGMIFFNSTGNPGMATAGSGDTLTGILTGLLAQRYAPRTAAMIGMYVHGLAGDLAAEKVGQSALIASDLIDSLGRAFQTLQL